MGDRPCILFGFILNDGKIWNLDFVNNGLSMIGHNSTLANLPQTFCKWNQAQITS